MAASAGNASDVMKLDRNNVMVCHSERSEDLRPIARFLRDESWLEYRIVSVRLCSRETRRPYLPCFFRPAAARPNLYGVDLA